MKKNKKYLNQAKNSWFKAHVYNKTTNLINHEFSQNMIFRNPYN